jgi:hypothetical protein
MTPPQGLKKSDMKGKVCELNTGLYGLKQASRIWYEQLYTELSILNYRQCTSEHCVYVKWGQRGVVITALFVDDIFLFYNDNVEMRDLYNVLSKRFPVKNLGTAQTVLGMRVKKDKDNTTLDPTSYINTVLEKFSMQDCKAVSKPLTPGIELVKGSCENNFPYQYIPNEI